MYSIKSIFSFLIIDLSFLTSILILKSMSFCRCFHHLLIPTDLCYYILDSRDKYIRARYTCVQCISKLIPFYFSPCRKKTYILFQLINICHERWSITVMDLTCHGLLFFLVNADCFFVVNTVIVLILDVVGSCFWTSSIAFTKI